MPRRPTRHLLDIRRRTGISQEELAALLHTSRSSIAMHETTGRGLPDNCTVYLGYIAVEMNRPENQASSQLPALSTAATEKWKKELQWLAKQKRYEAASLQRRMDRYEALEQQRRNRQLLPHCVAQAQEQLLQLCGDGPWQPITAQHTRWLDAIKNYSAFSHFNETAHLEYLRCQFRYRMLVHEAEEAEKIIADL